MPKYVIVDYETVASLIMIFAAIDQTRSWIEREVKVDVVAIM